MIESVIKPKESLFQVDLKHALVWVARALDYVGVDDIHHNHRVAYMAYHCAKSMGWEEKKQEFTFLAGLIHDCGVSQTSEHNHLIEQMCPENIEAHCIRGFNNLNQCEAFIPFASIILHHHTRWNDLIALPISPFEKDVAALIYLADRLDFLRAHYGSDCHKDLIILQDELIATSLQEHSGSLFRPDLVDAMIKLVHTNGFWFAMESENIESIPLGFSNLDWLDKQLDIGCLKQLGQFIAGIVDAKSPFTYQHSIKVAELSAYLAEQLHCDKTIVDMIYVAGLVHDIGKLRTPDEILHKRGKLSNEEYSHMKRHTIDTEFALNMVFPNSKIGEWACNHHERLNGKGYPYNKLAQELDLPSRIIAVADVFQALSQNRPYRNPVSPQKIDEMMQTMVDIGELDKQVYSTIQRNLAHCYRLSTE